MSRELEPVYERAARAQAEARVTVQPEADWQQLEVESIEHRVCQALRGIQNEEEQIELMTIVLNNLATNNTKLVRALEQWHYPYSPFSEVKRHVSPEIFIIFCDLLEQQTGINVQSFDRDEENLDSHWEVQTIKKVVNGRLYHQIDSAEDETEKMNILVDLIQYFGSTPDAYRALMTWQSDFGQPFLEIETRVAKETFTSFIQQLADLAGINPSVLS